MKTLYLDCGMGAAGDMLAAALLELHPHPELVLEKLNAAGIPGVEFRAEPVKSSGITGTHFSVLVHGQVEHSLDHHAEDHDHEHHHDHEHEHEHHHHHEHRSFADIEALVNAIKLPEPVREKVIRVYRAIAEAESHVHGETVEQIHFHEVGSMDAVADISAVCLLLHELSPDRIVASPVHVGSGQVHCAHGVLPVPAPATAYLLRGIPSYGGEVRGELCTPTGAALLRAFVTDFGPQPVMRTESVGYGMGSKEFPPMANCLRAMLGNSGRGTDNVAELACNLDDMTPEELAFAAETLMEAGALDVWTTPVGMKKGRSGMVLTVLCRESQREEMARLLFRHTTTLGVRETVCHRYVLDRSVETVDTAHGPVRIKRAAGWGVSRSKVEYEDAAKIARMENASLREARERLN